MILRDYQKCIVEQILNAPSLNNLVQLDTGGGKTAIIAAIASMQPTICVAHRNMLVEQISATLVRVGVHHNIIATAAIKKRCQLKMRGIEKINIGCHVSSLQSMISWHKLNRLNIDTSLPYLIIIDEAHHVADENMWHNLSKIFPNARFLGFTATPCRLDGMSLHREKGGLFDQIIQAKSLQKNSTSSLIAQGYLADYVCYCPPSSIDFDKLKKGAKGEYTAQSLVDAVSKQKIVGEVIQTYLKHAKNKKALVFCPSIANAEYIAAEFKASGISSSCIASSISNAENIRRLDAFRAGQIQVLVNVAMATEGFDLPEIECVIDLCPNASFGLVRQKWGRVLRPKKNGQKAIIIDHAANILKHGLPDDAVIWDIKGNPTQEKTEKINCEECHFVYDISESECPQCGHKSWLRAPTSYGQKMLKAEIIPAELVLKVREAWKEKDIEAEKLRFIAQHEYDLIHKPMPPNFEYGKDAISQLCKKLGHWIFESLKNIMPPRELNKFTQGDAPPISFYIERFTAKDLSSKQPEKAQRAVESWLSR